MQMQMNIDVILSILICGLIQITLLICTTLQLYEFNMDPTRKSFLDDLFTFMQNRGTPINRLPIMAKQVIISKVEILFHSLTTTLGS